MDETNHTTLDRFTLVHALAGYGAAAAGLHWSWAVLGALAFELTEDRAKDVYPRAFPNPSHDSKRNALADVAAFTLGYIARRSQ